MATGTVRIVLVVIGVVVGALVIARAFPETSAPAATSDTSPVDDDTTTGGDGGQNTGGGGEQTDGQGGGGDGGTGMDVSILVSNGTDVSGLAETTADFITGLGYTNVDFGDADSGFSETTIYYRPDVREEAQELKDAVYRRAILRRATADSDYQINVVLGADYTEPA